MAATRFERPAALFAAVSLAAMIAAFALSQARAQPVNPVPPPPPPVFNPSGPGTTVPQPPEVPVSPALPPSVVPQPAVTPSPVVTPPPTVTPQAATAPAPEKPALSRTHGRYHGPMRRWSRRHVRFHAVRVLGPSYYPGLGEFYPPYPNPCHFRRVWQGYYAPYWTYTCGW